jgi:transposase
MEVSIFNLFPVSGCLRNDLKVLQAEMVKLKAELRRTAEERDILKKAAAYFAKQSE